MESGKLTAFIYFCRAGRTAFQTVFGQCNYGGGDRQLSTAHHWMCIGMSTPPKQLHSIPGEGVGHARR